MSSVKPFWFAFNVTVWLSSKSVRLMSLVERGAYIGLLALAWGEDVPGTLPVDEDEVRRMAEMSPEQWAISGPRLLKKFPLSECGTHRYNPRLFLEGQEQRRKSELAAEAGRKSAEAKKQRKGNGTSTDVAKKPTDVEKTATERQLVTDTVTTTSSNEEKASKQREAASTSSTESSAPTGEGGGAAAGRPKEYRYDEAPVFLSKRFNAYLDEIGYSHVNKALYLLRISDGAKKAVGKKKLAELAPNADWETFIQRWLDNDQRSNKLLLPDGAAGQQQAFRPQERIVANPTATVAGGDLNSRIQTQQAQKYVL